MAQTPADLERAEQLFDEGTEAFEAGRYEAALEKMRESYSLSMSYHAAAGLGQVELYLGRHRDAAEHLDFSLRNFPKTADAEGKRQVMTGLEEARQHTFALSIVTNVSGAEILLDGNSLGQTPVDFDLYIDPGEHRLRVEREGYEPFEQALFAPAGGQKALDIELRPSGGHAAGAMHSDAALEADAGRSNWSPAKTWVLAVGGGVTLAAAGAGVWFWSDSSSETDRADDIDARLEETNTQCLDSAEARCAELLDARKSADSSSKLATAMFATAGIAAVATAGVFAWVHFSEADEPPHLGAMVSPVLTPQLSGLTVSGRF